MSCARKYRNRITIEEFTPSRGSDGSVSKTWSTYATVWAEKKHKTSREFFSAQRINSEITELFTIRYKSGITTKMRVSFNSKYYNIVGADDPDGKRREMQLLCKVVE